MSVDVPLYLHSPFRQSFSHRICELMFANFSDAVYEYGSNSSNVTVTNFRRMIKEFDREIKEQEVATPETTKLLIEKKQSLVSIASVVSRFWVMDALYAVLLLFSKSLVSLTRKSFIHRLRSSTHTLR